MVSMRVTAAAVVLTAATTVGIAAQDGAQEVGKALEEANAALRVKDTATYARFLADDVRWIDGSGVIHGKQDRLNEIPVNVPAISDIDARVVGDVAMVTATLTNTNGTKFRAARTLVKRDGRWQLALHAQIPVK